MSDPTPPPMPPPVPPSGGTPLTTTKPPKKSGGKNCLLYGCGGCGVVVLVLSLVGYFVFMSFMRSLTADPFPVAEISEARSEELDKTFEPFIAAQESEEPFTLPEGGMRISEQDINDFIMLEGGEMADSLRVQLQEGQITFEGRFGDAGQKDRVKVSGTMAVFQGAAGLEIQLTDIQLGKFSLPQAFMDEISQENIAEDMLEDPEFKKFIQESIGGIEVLDGEIILLPKSE